MNSAAPRSEDARPRVLYLLTAPISKVLVVGQLDAVDRAGFDVFVGVGCDGTTVAAATNGWGDAVTGRFVPFRRQPAPIADLRALFATIRLIRELDPRIVNASTPKAGLLGMLAARWCRVPVRIYQIRGLRFETTAGWRRRALIWLERGAARCATHVIVNSPSARVLAEHERIGKKRELVVIGAGSSNGIDLARYAEATPGSRAAARSALGLPPGGPVIGFIGRLTHDKGIADVLDVFESISITRNDVHLLLVGDFEVGDPVGGDAQQRVGRRTDITHLPWASDTSTIYPALDLLVFASAREGLPNVPLQAQAAAVPVVAYAATGTIDAVGDGVTGILVPRGDRTALAGAVADLLDDPVRRRHLGEAGPEWVRARFDQAPFWAQLTGLYREWLSAP